VSLRRALSALVVTTLSVATPAVFAAPARADLPDPVDVAVDLPVSYPDPMASPASAGAYLPPPPPSPAAAPPPAGGIEGTLADVEPPTEGWTVYRHWKQNGDGTVSGEFYLGPQFRPVAGEWLPIDPALTTLATGAVSSAASLLPTTFGLDTTHLLALTVPGGVVTERLAGPPLPVVPSVSGQQVTYGDVRTDSDIQLDVGVTGVKELIVLGSAAAPTTWQFHLSDPTDALGDVTALGDGGYRFTNPVAPETYLTLPAPYAYEQVPDGVAPPVSLESAHQTVTKAGDGYDVTLSVDADWLSGKSFPIVLDPTVQYTNTQVTSWENSAVSSGNTQCGSDVQGCSGYVPPASNPNAMGAATQTEKVGTVYNIDARPARAFYKFATSNIQYGSSVTTGNIVLFQNGCFGFDPTQYQCDKHNYTEYFSPFNRNYTVSNTYRELRTSTDTGLTESHAIAAFPGGTRTAITFDIRQNITNCVLSEYTVCAVSQRLSSEPATGNIGGPSFSGVNDPIASQRPVVNITWSPPPNAPRSVTASAPNNTSVAVSWVAPTSNGGPAVTSYTAELFTPDGSLFRTLSCASSATTPCTSRTFTSVPYGTYYAKVYATNSVGDGPESAASNSVTLSPAPVLTKSVSPAATTTFGRGQELTFTLHVVNPGPAAMNVDSVTDAVPSGLLATSTPVTLGGSACGTLCSFSGSTLDVGLFSVPANGAVDIVYKAVAVGAERACSTATNSARAANAYGASTSAVTVTICDTALGVENWWSYVRTEVAAESDAMVNVANGNLVVRATDSTPTQAHGRLGYLLRRTYNSMDTNVLTLPGSIGAGWQLNLGEVSDVSGAGVLANNISVPTGMGPLTPMAVTLVDRDGTRHVFRFSSLATSVSLGSVTSGTALGSLLPRVLDVTKYANVCVDGTYTSPPGVHLSLYRYVGVSSSGCGSLSSGVVLGFAAVRTDRLRTEYSWNGRLLSMVDGSGVELRYKYEQLPLAAADLGRLTDVYESRLLPNGSTPCAFGGGNGCRGYRLSYGANNVDVTDGAGRTTRYMLDNATPRHLVQVINPPEVVSGGPSDHVSYTYDGFGDDCDGVTTNATGQLCSVTDARGKTTRFGYGAAPLGPKRVTSVRDRRLVTTTLSYFSSPDYVTADRGTERVRYLNIDPLGRVGEVDEGNTSDVYLRQTVNTWDGTGCRAGTTAGDNNLCRVARTSFTAATPNEVTDFYYSPEGELLAQKKANPGGTPASLDTTYDQYTQYVRADGTTTVVADTATGNGGTTSGVRPTGGSPTLYVISDRIGMLPPRGNAAGAAYANYKTVYNVARSTTANPNAVPGTSQSCASRNSGSLCSLSEPHEGTTKAVTTYDYDTYGQRTVMSPPQGSAYYYEYYPDTARDLSGWVSAGGWMKDVWAVGQGPQGAFVAFAYDAAGNVVRTWDRNKTAGQYPGSFQPATAPGYAEALYGSLSRPWRYVTSQRDPLGNTTETTVDRNGNPLTTRPPRGTAAGSAAYDVTRTFDDAGNVLTELAPAEAAANKPTTYTYDAFGNRTSVTDPNGSVTVTLYDSVNRPTTTRFTRGAFPTDGTQPAGCQQSATTTADAPLPTGKLACSRSQSYDGVGNVLTRTDPDAQTTTFTYDAVHRQVKQVVPRNDGVLGTLRTDTVYDADGHVTDVCPPRSFAEGGATACAATDPYGTHTTYDEAGRARTVTTYRTAGGPALTTTFGYDVNGNRTTVTDANGHTVTNTYDNVNRLASTTVPRDAGTDSVTWFRYDPVGNLLSKTEPGVIDNGTGVDGDLTIDGSTYNAANPYVMATGKNFRNLTLVNGAVVTVAPWNGASGGRLDIRATGTVSICSSCSIDVSGKGPAGSAGSTSVTAPAATAAGAGPGGGGSPGAVNGGGGGGGGHASYGMPGTTVTGGGAAGDGGQPYGSATITGTGGITELGSGGGGGGAGGVNGGGNGGSGGGYVRIVANRLTNDGAIRADGKPGQSGTTGVGGSAGGGGGGGSGGSVWITATQLRSGGGPYLGTVTEYGAAGGSGSTAGGSGANGFTRVDSDVPGYTPVGRITAYSYDADNRLVDTVVASSSFDAASAGTTSSDGGRNVRTRIVYDADGHVAGRYEPRAFATSTTSPDPRYLTRADFDADGRVSATYSPRYDTAVTPDLGIGGTQNAQCPTGASPQTVAGLPSYPASTGVCVSRFGYDYAGNLTRITLPTSNGTDNRYLTTTYTDDNLAATTTAPDPAQPSATARATTARTIYDGSGRPVRVTDALNHQTVTTYTADGLVASVSGQPASDSTTNHFAEYLYDAAGQRTRSTTWLNHAVPPATQATPVLRVSSTTYYTDGRVKDVYGTGTSATDPARDRTSYTYDNVGNPTQVKSPSANAGDANNTAGVATVNTYTYDNLLLTSTVPVAANGSSLRRTTYGYDAAGHKASVGSALVNASGTVTQNGGTQRFAYYPDDRMSQQTGRNGETIALQYDPAGHATSVVATPTTGSAVTTTATYWLDGLVRTVTERGHTSQASYDASGHRAATAEVVDATGARTLSTFGYSDAGQVTGMTSDVTGTTRGWGYDSAGRLATATIPNGTTVTRTYNPDNTLATQSLTANATGAALARWDYTHDPMGRIRAANRGTSSAPSLDCAPAPASLPAGLHCFDYDSAGRLSQFKDATADRALAWDHDGNRLSYGPSGNAATFSYNADDSLATSQAGPSAPVRHETYAPFGGRTGDECTTLTYDGFDRLASSVGTGITGCARARTDYTYDGLDRQVTRAESGTGAVTPGTTSVYYDALSSRLLQEVMPDGAVVDYGMVGGSPVSVRRTGSQAATQYLTDDGMGSVSTATTTSGAVACSLRYDPFGGPLNPQSDANACSTGSTPSSLLYRESRRDQVTGAYQLGSRTYDPAQASFLTPDTFRSAPSSADLGVGTDPLMRNTYTYVNGDPVNWSDPDGHRRPEDWLGADPKPYTFPKGTRVRGDHWQHDTAVILSVEAAFEAAPAGSQICADVPGMQVDLPGLPGCLIPRDGVSKDHWYRPDLVVLDPSGVYHVYEIKPDTPSQVSKGAKQLKRNLDAMGSLGLKAVAGHPLPPKELNFGTFAFRVFDSTRAGVRVYRWDRYEKEPVRVPHPTPQAAPTPQSVRAPEPTSEPTPVQTLTPQPIPHPEPVSMCGWATGFGIECEEPPILPSWLSPVAKVVGAIGSSLRWVGEGIKEGAVSVEEGVEECVASECFVGAL
jgi:RHS repeat-associated protein/uncharacterized repeat protein (TIGR01451 family)